MGPVSVVDSHRMVWAESLLMEFFSWTPFSPSSLVTKRTAASCWTWSEPDPPFFRTSTTSPSFSSTVFLPWTRGLLNTAGEDRRAGLQTVPESTYLSI